MDQNQEEIDRLEMRLVVIEHDIESLREDGLLERSSSAWESYQSLRRDKSYIEQELGYSE